MHFIIGISLIWFIGALVIWILWVFIFTVLISKLAGSANEDINETPKENKNPYSNSKYKSTFNKGDCRDYYPLRLLECLKLTFVNIGIPGEVITELYESIKGNTPVDTGNTVKKFLYLLSEKDRLYICKDNAPLDDVLFCVLSDAGRQELSLTSPKQIIEFIGDNEDISGKDAAFYIASKLSSNKDIAVGFCIYIINTPDGEFFTGIVSKEKSKLFINNLNIILSDCDFNATLL